MLVFTHTCIIHVYSAQVFDNYAVTVMIGGEPYTLGLFDTAGKNYLAVLSYQIKELVHNILTYMYNTMLHVSCPRPSPSPSLGPSFIPSCRLHLCVRGNWTVPNLL